VNERLCALLILDTDEDGGWPSHRVAVIGDNPLFPPEWRQAAWSTLLPDRLPAWSARWRRWYDAVMAGQFRHYVHRLRTWEASRELARAQTALIGAARATEGRTNAWTRKATFLRARQLVFALPAPPVVPAPGPPVDNPGDDRATPDQAAHMEAVTEHFALLEQATRTFSRTVPGPFKRNPRWSPVVTEPVPDTWLEEFFAWLDPVVRSGRGLYLWL
jgi:hypothetical protein